uniref:Uncharacterized protein n=1 Tax=Sphaerodactylus townsendi TaxID=933632 RepID=A0ACB8G0K0_9SAUR
MKGSGLQNKTFHCEICDVHVNSEIQLKQHISSRRHKDRVAGKPTKPKFSPYNKLQRSPSILALPETHSSHKQNIFHCTLGSFWFLKKYFTLSPD